MDQVRNNWLLNGFALSWALGVLYGLLTGNSSVSFDRSAKKGNDTMQDIFYIVVTLIFFLMAAAYVRGCDKL